jgi:hypothetical protein
MKRAPNEETCLARRWAEFVRSGEEQAGGVRSVIGMSCSHEGFHGISSAYDRTSGVLHYFWTCERCGARLRKARSEEYRPSYDPRGNDRFLPLSR